MHRSLCFRSLVVLAVLAGVAGADSQQPKDKPKAPVKTEVSAADAEKFLAFFNKFVDTMVADKEDCAKMTRDINALIDANAEMVKKFQDAKAAGKELPADAKQKMLSRVKEMMPAMQKCGQDPGFNAAMARMQAKAPPAKEPAKTPDQKEKTPPKK